MKRNKSADLNGVVADVFIDSKQFISPFLCSIFNHIFNTDIYPESWSKGTIIPIHKKGDPNNPTNYRGITIVNTVAKIFSLLLRVADADFILHTSIQKILATNKKLWCIFIDYERAFDTVNRDALWAKLKSTD